MLFLTTCGLLPCVCRWSAGNPRQRSRALPSSSSSGCSSVCLPTAAACGHPRAQELTTATEQLLPFHSLFSVKVLGQHRGILAGVGNLPVNLKGGIPPGDGGISACWAPTGTPPVSLYPFLGRVRQRLKGDSTILVSRTADGAVLGATEMQGRIS